MSHACDDGSVEMFPQPLEIAMEYRGSGKLEGKVALITGGDSGIGRSIALHFAREGAEVALTCRNEDEDSENARDMIEAAGVRCLMLQGDIGDADFCRSCVERVIDEFHQLDILVNNASEHHELDQIEEMAPAQLERTFRTNVFSMFYLTQAALKYMKKGSCIINSSSVTVHRGSGYLLDDSVTKAAIVSYTRFLAQELADRCIRVNAVAAGPIWTHLIPAVFKPEELPEFGRRTLMRRPGHPAEVAPAYVFLASSDSPYMTGQVLYPNGGE